MKYYLILAIITLFVGCKTCPQNKEIKEHIVTNITGHFECGNTEPMYEAVENIVNDLDYCGEFNSQRYVKYLPDGNWTAKAICCFATLGPIEKLKAEKEWNCKKKIDYKTLMKACQELE